MKYPLPEEIEPELLCYGCSAPIVGFGSYTTDRKYSWPDRECTNEIEYRRWEKHLIDNGYEIPERYKEAFVK